jgi:hypothetical protein
LILTVVIPTTRGITALEPCLEPLIPQALAHGGRILVVDGSGEPAPAPRPPIDWVSVPGDGVFALRRRGMQLASSPLVAVIEDHCVPAADWWEAVVRAHAELPCALAIGGRAENGSAATAVERASFMMSLLPCIPQLDRSHAAGHLSISCTSFRRRDDWELDVAGMPRVGHTDIAKDARIVVTHVQPGSWWQLAALQFHNGRAMSGERSVWALRDWLRLVGAGMMAWPRTLRQVRACAVKGVPFRELGACAPAFLWLFYAKAAGEVAGYLAGPGNSANRLQ